MVLVTSLKQSPLRVTLEVLCRWSWPFGGPSWHSRSRRRAEELQRSTTNMVAKDSSIEWTIDTYIYHDSIWFICKWLATRFWKIQSFPKMENMMVELHICDWSPIPLDDPRSSPSVQVSLLELSSLVGVPNDLNNMIANQPTRELNPLMIEYDWIIVFPCWFLDDWIWLTLCLLAQTLLADLGCPSQ